MSRSPELVPEITLIIPTKDRANKVDRLLRSVEPQRLSYGEKLQILIVDSSKDKETQAVSRNFSAEHVYFPYLGKTAALNASIRQVFTPYLAFLDDDTVAIRPDWLSQLHSNFTLPEIAYVSGRVVAFNTSNEAAKKWEQKGALNKGADRIYVDSKFFRKFRFTGVPVQLVTMGANHMMKKDVLLEIGMHDERFGPGQQIGGAGADLDLTYKVLKAGYSIVYDPTAVVAHEHPNSMKELRSKLFVYGISDTAVHTKFLFEFGDYRSAFQLGYRPLQNFGRFLKSVLKMHPLPPHIHLASIAGNLVGPFSYFRHRKSPSVTNS